jgi:LemA protein
VTRAANTGIVRATWEKPLGFALAALAVVLLGWVIWAFNRLVHDRNLVSQAFADIDVQLKRRADLVPQLVEAVRAYAAYERQTLQAVTELRARATAEAARGGPSTARFGIERELGAWLHKLVVLQESYPGLKADQNFRDLAAKLVDAEDQLQYARRFYNGAVKQYLTRLQSFPDLIVARLFAFREAVFFETDDRAPVQVTL